MTDHHDAEDPHDPVPEPGEPPEDPYDQIAPDIRDDRPPAGGAGGTDGRTPEQRLADLEAAVGELIPVIERFDEQLQEVFELFRGAPDGPYRWQSLNPRARQRLWERLYAWVRWFEDRYLAHLGGERLRLVADWYRHPVAVELLTALMVSYDAAYSLRASRPSTALVDWHERCLAPVMARLAEWRLFSPDADHQDWDGPASKPRRRNDDRFAAFLKHDLAAHQADTPATDKKPQPANATSATGGPAPTGPAAAEAVAAEPVAAEPGERP